MSHLSQRHSTKRTVSNNPPIANEINTATRALHTELNRLIIDRLPLALPPSATSPARYAAGLHRFAQIFFAFENAFQAVAKQSLRVTEDKRSEHGEAVAGWVAHLPPPALFRSARLRDDLEHLQILKHDAAKSTYGGEKLAQLMQDALERPHILVAYAWVMYMAIFSGGRWIRSELSSAGPAFWLGIDEAAGLQINPLPGFSFLSFDDERDGEDLKSKFKAHLELADGLLTVEERQEVVATGVDVFQQCIQLIEQIDRDVWWNEYTTSWPLALALLLSGLLYIGWVVYKGEPLFPNA